MAYYRKKPVTIQAVQFWPGQYPWPDPVYACTACPDGFALQSLEGRMNVTPGDWIIRGVKGEFYPCKPDIFEQTYELVEETNEHRRES